MKATAPDGSTKEITSAEIARQCVDRYHELAKQFKNVTMNFGKGKEVMTVKAGELGWKGRIERLMDEQWVPRGFLYAERTDEGVTMIHLLSWPLCGGEETGKMQAEILDVAAEKLRVHLGLTSLGGEA
jgi:hypothetical protein